MRSPGRQGRSGTTNCAGSPSGSLTGLTRGSRFARTPLRSPAEVDAGELFGVRQTSEVSTSPVAGARHIELGRPDVSILAAGPSNWFAAHRTALA